MTELTADIFVSLDGYAYGVDSGPYFGYSGPELDRWIRDGTDRPQLILMGRVTYEELLKYSAADDDTGLSNVPKVVFSNSLREPLAWSNARLMSGDLAAEIGGLKRRSADPLRTIGSLTLVRSLLRLGLVDRLRLMVFPLVLGPAGREPFFADYARTGFELIETTVLDSRLVLLEYRPARG